MNGRAVCPNSGAVSSGTSGQSEKELGLKTRLSFFYVKLRHFNKI
nr:MAG TPA: hypothetical protein [Bacteriophage sp.]